MRSRRTPCCGRQTRRRLSGSGIPAVSDRKKVSDLRTDANDARLEGTNLVARTAVTRNLIVDVADQSYQHLLGQELRRAPVEVKVDAVLIIGARVHKIVSEPRDSGEFVPRRQVQVSIADAAISRAVPDAEIGQTSRAVGADRDASCSIDHEIVDAFMPLHRGLRKEVAKTSHCVGDAIRSHEAEWRNRSGYRSGQRSPRITHKSSHAHRSLAAEERRCKHVGRIDEENGGVANAHVPLVVAHPAAKAGAATSALTSHLDLLPTFAGLIGLPEANRPAAVRLLPGRDFSGLLVDPEKAGMDAVRPGVLFNYVGVSTIDGDYLTKVMSSLALRQPQPPVTQANLNKRGFLSFVFDGRFKLARFYAPAAFNTPQTLEEILKNNDVQLFDLESDPEEMHNLALQPEKNRATILRMNQLLNDLMAKEVGVNDGHFLPQDIRPK